jgi:hypothetical protein
MTWSDLNVLFREKVSDALPKTNTGLSENRAILANLRQIARQPMVQNVAPAEAEVHADNNRKDKLSSPLR